MGSAWGCAKAWDASRQTVRRIIRAAVTRAIETTMADRMTHVQEISDDADNLKEKNMDRLLASLNGRLKVSNASLLLAVRCARAFVNRRLNVSCTLVLRSLLQAMIL